MNKRVLFETDISECLRACSGASLAVGNTYVVTPCAFIGEGNAYHLSLVDEQYNDTLHDVS